MMSDRAIDYGMLAVVPRLLMECDLRPLQGDRFQPTGFPDLGPARYTRPDGTEMLLVESAQSVANRLEAAIWDDAADDVIEPLRGLPYIVVTEKRNGTNGARKLTNSILEAHRINSPYILEGADKKVFDLLKRDAAGLEMGPVRLSDLAGIVFKYDPNAVLHGVFLAKSDLAGGRLRLPRAMSGFVEGEGINPAESGGVKNDRVDPSGDATKGFGNVPFHRTEFVARRITAYFNLDLALLRGYGLPDQASKLLIALALLKVRRFLSAGLRLRTACDLEPVHDGLRVTRPSGFSIPEEDMVREECNRLIQVCTKDGLFAKPPVTQVEWRPSTGRKGEKAKEPEPSEEEADSDEDAEP